MFTMAKIRNGSTYLGNHLSANDYYAEGEKVRGYWIGQGAAMLRLAGDVESQQFEALRSNEHPIDGGPLTPRKRADRVAFFDFQCSAQKSVSLMALLGGDDRLRHAHEDAAKTAFGELEQFAARQQNSQTARQSVLTGNVCAAGFVHDASRALDPQLHTHFVVANATRDNHGRWVALTEFEMVKAIRYAGKVYQNELARKVRALGYSIQETRDDKGQVIGFEIEGVSEELCRRFAKRRVDIEREIARFRQTSGREPTTAEIGHITRETRSAKLSEISTPAVRDQQRAQLTSEEMRQLHALRERALDFTRGVEEGGREMRSLQASVDHLFERRSVARKHEILAEALNQGLGTVEVDKLKKALLERRAGVVALTSEDSLLAEFATERGLELERWSVVFVNATKDRHAPLNADFLPSEMLSAEQRAAVRAILSTGDQVFSFRGVAGAGKTTTLQEVHRGLAEGGHRALYIAPTTAATKVLQTEGFANATTVEDFLQNVAVRESLRGTVIVCDEAGLKNNRQGAALLHLAQQRGLRVVLVGDVRQHVSVEAGDFLRVLETHSTLGRCEVAEIRRQQTPAYKGAVERMAAGDARGGLAALDALGWLHEGGADYLQRAAANYLRLTRDGDLERALLIAPTWAENHRLTDEIRSGLEACGYLTGPGTEFVVHDSLQWTAQQKRRAANYRAGQSIVFTRPTGNWKAGDSAEVRSVRRDGKVTLWANGAEHRLPLRTAESFDVGQPRSVMVASGDKLLVRANNKRIGLINGQILTVAAVEGDGSIRTKEGVRVPSTFRQWCHGYVVTSHKAQGRTCEHVIVAAERLDAKSAYVGCSRGKISCSVYTPDKRRLLERLPEGGRRAALDVLANAGPQLPATILRRADLWNRLFGGVASQIVAGREILRRRTEEARLTVQRCAFVRSIFEHGTGLKRKSTIHRTL
jgi:conjugative relaxase-like TrwC/TraI family protein